MTIVLNIKILLLLDNASAHLSMEIFQSWDVFASQHYLDSSANGSRNSGNNEETVYI